MTNVADWLISSREWTDETPTIDASPETVSASLGGLYLEHPTAALSMLAQVEAAMTAAGVADASATLLENRVVRLSSSATFSITWNSATTLRDLLGFAGDLASASSYDAPAQSQLLWSPGKIMTPELAPLDTHGMPVLDVSVTQGPRGRQTVREEGLPTEIQNFTMRHVPLARFWPTRPGDGEPGDWRHFWRNEITKSRRWIVLRSVQESSTATPADYASAVKLGPYVGDMTDTGIRRFRMRRSQGFARVEAHYDVEIPAIVTSEFE